MNKQSFSKNKKNVFRKNKIIYEPEDDVLNIWLSDKPYEYGEDDGNLIITHYTKDDEPVYIEVLFASRFFKDAGPDFSKRAKKAEDKIKNVHTISIPLEIKKT
ncbi:DUF2283 domain-containing protein [Candidatus Daviesbacteria bacterium]|nr:DUF2283 domain-containing protein [Candidatus Daviesbacteria bacterium]